MSDAAPRGSEPTNETTNEKGGYNKRNSKNRNVRRPDMSDERLRTEKFKGKAEWLPTLGVQEDKCMDPLMVFQTEFHAYVFSN